uniref:Uncharacterized protein n=1 Tax=Oryza meridionalis TaxID=40149 RepID=A0A0E0DRS3_9ORYZ
KLILARYQVIPIRYHVILNHHVEGDTCEISGDTYQKVILERYHAIPTRYQLDIPDIDANDHYRPPSPKL